MKTTVDIPGNELEEAMKHARAKTKRDAIVTALLDYNRRQRIAALVDYSGTSSSLMSNAAIEELDGEVYRPRNRRRHGRGRRS